MTESPPRAAAVPHRCFWEITRACDHRCIHCRTAACKPLPDELSTATALDVADQLVAMGVRRVVLTGGEPTLRPDWEQIARRLATGGVNVRLFTGGYSLGKRLLGRARDAGVAEYALSLDGPQEVHDHLRPTRGMLRGSSYRKALSAIELLVAEGLDPRVVTVASRASIPALGRTLDIVRELGVHRWQVNLCQASGRARDHLDRLMPQPDDLEHVVQVLLRARKDGDVVAPLHCSIGYMTAEEPVLRRPLSKKGLVWRGTPAGLRTLAITAAGKVLGCTALPDEFATASVRERPLAEIWSDDACFPYSRGFDTSLLAGECAECKLAPICRAGCPAVAYGATGAIGTNPYCLRVLRKRKEPAGGTRRAPGE